MLYCVKLKWKLHLYTPKKKKKSLWHPPWHSSYLTRKTAQIFFTEIFMVINQWNITLFIPQIIWMQRARHDFISGKPDVSDSMWRCQRSALAQCIVLLTLWFIILSCLGRCNKRPSHNILLNRSIVHAIRLHVSELQWSGAVNAHNTCVPCPSTTEPHSGPPLTIKPGPAKRTTSERGTGRSH